MKQADSAAEQRRSQPSQRSGRRSESGEQQTRRPHSAARFPVAQPDAGHEEVGPNLKDIRLKLNKNWIPVWLKKPTDFRPTTKMPNFRLTDHQIQAISAYFWQSAFTDSLPKQKTGNADHGKELFETRGCLACHSIGEGDQMRGRHFRRESYPRRRKRQLRLPGPLDPQRARAHRVRTARTRRKTLALRTTRRRVCRTSSILQHSHCPNDGHELQVQNMTVMPSLRLSLGRRAGHRDLSNRPKRSKEPSSYPEAAFMDDPS